MFVNQEMWPLRTLFIEHTGKGFCQSAFANMRVEFETLSEAV